MYGCLKINHFQKLTARMGCTFLLLVLGVQAAWADLMITPTRVVFEANQRAAQVELINRGNSTGTYRISVVNRRMGPAGGFSEVDMTEPPLDGELFADRMVRFSPRQVTLAPGEFQTVRLMVRKPAELEAGEYRSHILFERLPEPATETSQSAAAQRQLSVSFSTVLNVSIPVIVRHGETRAETSISELAVTATETGNAVLALQINRIGNRSLYGDLRVYHAPPGRNEELLAQMNGLAVYVPNSHRIVNIALPRTAAQITGGTLRVVYSARAEDGGQLLAETQASLR